MKYKFMHWIHATFFEESMEQGGLMSKVCTWADRHPWSNRFMYHYERMCKYPLVRCQGCGSCSLPETAYVCTESGCAKRLPNGQCGGSKVGDECEVRAGVTCAWVRVYREAHAAGRDRPVTYSQRHGTSGNRTWPPPGATLPPLHKPAPGRFSTLGNRVLDGDLPEN